MLDASAVTKVSADDRSTPSKNIDATEPPLHVNIKWCNLSCVNNDVASHRVRLPPAFSAATHISPVPLSCTSQWFPLATFHDPNKCGVSAVLLDLKSNSTVDDDAADMRDATFTPKVTLLPSADVSLIQMDLPRPVTEVETLSLRVTFVLLTPSRYGTAP
jgi:hypothetical protein